jgi:hypothetical protein
MGGKGGGVNVNPKNLLFEGLTRQERDELLKVVEGIILHGLMPKVDNVFAREWMKVAEYSERQWLLTMSTSFPQRALLSIVYFDEFARA